MCAHMCRSRYVCICMIFHELYKISKLLNYIMYDINSFTGGEYFEDSRPHQALSNHLPHPYSSFM